mmetsp:Transcript_25290/g.58727  ORF Transcript_25290/g.58727 Transcript_25290/m.58727 type:complete len:288 (+) Transcript_25290:74-937(+)
MSACIPRGAQIAFASVRPALSFGVSLKAAPDKLCTNIRAPSTPRMSAMPAPAATSITILAVGLLSIACSITAAPATIMDSTAPSSEHRASFSKTLLCSAFDNLYFTTASVPKMKTDGHARMWPHIIAVRSSSLCLSASNVAALWVADESSAMAVNMKIPPIPMPLFRSRSLSRASFAAWAASSSSKLRTLGFLNRQRTKAEEIPSRKASPPKPTRESDASITPMVNPRAPTISEAAKEATETHLAARMSFCSLAACSLNATPPAEQSIACPAAGFTALGEAMASSSG